MKKKVVLIVLFAGLLALTAQAHWRLQQNEERIDWLLSGIEEMAREDAERDISAGTPSYRMLGTLPKALYDDFQDHFKEYQITGTFIGCIVTDVQSVYSAEYNRVLREHVVAKYRRDLFKEFFDSYWEK